MAAVAGVIDGVEPPLGRLVKNSLREMAIR
jgi:hypothetical protein